MNSTVPRAVREQLKRADELRANMNAPEVTPATDTAPAEQPAQPQPEAQAVPPVQETPAPAAQAEPAPTPAPAPAQSDDWEHKYRVLQGIHQADVQRARDLADQNRQLRDLISRMQEAQQQQQAQQTQQQPPAQQGDKKYSFVKKEEVEEYGEELMDVIERKAKEQYLPLIESLQTHITNLEQRLTQQVNQVQQVATVSAKDSFFAKLDSKVPYWEKLNTEQGFLNWLDSADELSGVTRRDMFNRAYQNFDDARVAKFFQTYAAQSGFQAEPPASPANALKPVVPADQLQSPGRTTSASQVQTKKVWTRQEIAAFYENARKGVYKGKEAERRRIEEDIFNAGREGRIAA